MPSVSQEERDARIVEHLPLVRSIALRLYESLPVHVDVDDLVHAGILGLIDAAARYDTEKQVSFRAYAKHRIRGAILDSLRDLDWASRDLRRRHKQLDAVTHEFAAKMERTPTEAEIAEKMGMDVTRWRQVAVDMQVVGLVSASTRPADDENQTAPEFPATDHLNPDVLAGRTELRGLLSAAMGTLPARYQTVIGLYYLGGKTMREIGNRLGINESRVSQIHTAALSKMGVNLQAAGIHSASCLM
jgi:RNA polymerase sigma factor for flagellar operon FliA